MNLSEIKRSAARVLGISGGMLEDRCRDQRHAKARWLVMTACRHYSRQSLPQIGAAFGGRDHTTILYGLRRANEECTTDPNFYRDMARTCAAVEIEILYQMKQRQDQPALELVRGIPVALLPPPQRPAPHVEPGPCRRILVPA